jgi:hypothetical protein
MPGPWQIILILFILGLVILPVIALVDVLRSRFRENMQIIWVLVILLLPLIGAILYFAIGREQKIQ